MYNLLGHVYVYVYVYVYMLYACACVCICITFMLSAQIQYTLQFMFPNLSSANPLMEDKCTMPLEKPTAADINVRSQLRDELVTFQQARTGNMFKVQKVFSRVQ